MRKQRQEIDMFGAVSTSDEAKVERWRQRGAARSIQSAYRRHNNQKVTPRDATPQPPDDTHVPAGDRGSAATDASAKPDSQIAEVDQLQRRPWLRWQQQGALRWDQDDLDRAAAAMDRVRSSVRHEQEAKDAAESLAAASSLSNAVPPASRSTSRKQDVVEMSAESLSGELERLAAGSWSARTSALPGASSAVGAAPSGAASVSARRAGRDAKALVHGYSSISGGVGAGAAGLEQAARALLQEAGRQHRASGDAVQTLKGGERVLHQAAQVQRRADALWGRAVRSGALTPSAAASRERQERAGRLASLVRITALPPTLPEVLPRAGPDPGCDGAESGTAEGRGTQVDRAEAFVRDVTSQEAAVREAGKSAHRALLQTVAAGSADWASVAAAGASVNIAQASLPVAWRGGTAGRAATGAWGGWPQLLPSAVAAPGRVEAAADAARRLRAACGGESPLGGGEASDWWTAYVIAVGGVSAAAGRSRVAEQARVAEGGDAMGREARVGAAAAAAARPALEALAAAQPPLAQHWSRPGRAADTTCEREPSMPPGAGLLHLELWGMRQAGTAGEGFAEADAGAEESNQRGPMLPPAVVGTAMERLGVADPWTPGLHAAIAAAMPDTRARSSAHRTGTPLGGSEMGAAGTPAAMGAVMAKAEADAEAAGEAAAAAAAAPSDVADRGSAARLLAALEDPSHPLSMQSALRAAPAFSAPALSLPGVRSVPRMGGLRPVAEQGDGGEAPRGVTRPYTRSTGDISLATRLPASMAKPGVSMTDRVLVAVRQLERQRYEGELSREARAQARELQARMLKARRQLETIAGRKVDGATGTETRDDGGNKGKRAATPSAAGVAFPTSGLQTVRAADGSEFVVLTAEQLQAITAATASLPDGRRAASSSLGQPRPVTPPLRPRSGGARGASPGAGQMSPRQRAGRLCPASPGAATTLPAGGGAGERAARWESDDLRRSTEAHGALNASRDSALSDGATEVGVVVKRSFGLSATPSAPKGRSVYLSDQRRGAKQVFPTSEAVRHGLGRSHSPIQSPPRQPSTSVGVYSGAALGQAL